MMTPSLKESKARGIRIEVLPLKGIGLQHKVQAEQGGENLQSNWLNMKINKNCSYSFNALVKMIRMKNSRAIRATPQGKHDVKVH